MQLNNYSGVFNSDNNTKNTSIANSDITSQREEPPRAVQTQGKVPLTHISRGVAKPKIYCFH